MTATTTPNGSATSAATEIALSPGDLWFLGQPLVIESSSESSAGHVAVTDVRAPRGSGSPLHVHRNEDEWFYVIEGELTFWVGGHVIDAAAGSFVYGPRDVPHTFIVTSEEARFLLVTEPAGFYRFLRPLAQPAQQLVVPPAASDAPDMQQVVASAAEHGIEILGPPGIPA